MLLSIPNFETESAKSQADELYVKKPSKERKDIAIKQKLEHSPKTSPTSQVRAGHGDNKCCFNSISVKFYSFG